MEPQAVERGEGHFFPLQLTSLIGRDREVRVVVDLLERPGLRLQTLTGPGGTGETRLALAASARLLGNFEDGVYFVDLSSIRDHSQVPSTIARVLSVHESGDRPLAESMLRHLSGRSTLLVLDNFEQVLDAAPTVSALLLECPRLKILVTSRAALHLGDLLASQGFIVVSVSANGVNAYDETQSADCGMTARGQLVYAHLQLWSSCNSTTGGTFGSLFTGRVNMNAIGLMGHSRGGEGVVRAFQINAANGSPFGIRAVFPLAPVDFNRPIINNVPMAVLLPYCDGDVSSLEGVHFYDDSRYNVAGDTAPKHAILVMGANHNFYNTVWTPGAIPGGSDDWLKKETDIVGTAVDPFCNPTAGGHGHCVPGDILPRLSPWRDGVRSDFTGRLASAGIGPDQCNQGVLPPAIHGRRPPRHQPVSVCQQPDDQHAGRRGNNHQSRAAHPNAVPAAPPTVSGSTPPGAMRGQGIAINGTNLAGATSVRFNGTTATTFSVVTNTQIMATVPNSATSGPISVTTPGGAAASSTNFSVYVNAGRVGVQVGDQPGPSLSATPTARACSEHRLVSCRVGPGSEYSSTMIEIPLLDGPRMDVSASVSGFLKLMADPTRRRIFLELMNGETCNCEIGSLLGLPQNLISHHLRQLRQAGLIHARRDATDRRWIYYSVDLEVLARVYQEIGLVFSPDRCGTREPQCGPTAPGCQ